MKQTYWYVATVYTDEPLMNAAYGIIVVKMPGWRKSKSIAFEIDTFKRAGKPVLYMEWPLESE